MNQALQRYFWVFNLLTIAICTTFVAKGCGSVVEANLPVAGAASPLGAASPMVATATDVAGPRDIAQILSRNIFCSTCEPEAPEDPNKAAGADDASGGPANDGAPVKTTLSLKLLATMVSEQDPRWSFAAIMQSETEDTGLYAIGSTIAGTAEITDITERRVLLHHGGRSEYIDLPVEQGGGPDAPNTSTGAPPPIVSTVIQPTPIPGMDDIAKGIRQIGPGKYEIQRTTLNKVLSNTTMLARSARIIPSMKDGQPDGFKLFGVRPGSVYSLLGLQNADTLNAVNGHPITTPDKALEVYTKLRSASQIAITFSRGGQTISHDYTIR